MCLKICHVTWCIAKHMCDFLAPKLRTRLEPVDPVGVFLSYGRGYRSPDARGVTPGERAPVATADSFEAGTTIDPTPWLALRTAGFATLVSDEVVFDHVTARYLTTGQTRRLGIDSGVAVSPIDALRISADLTWSDGRYPQRPAPAGVVLVQQPHEVGLVRRAPAPHPAHGLGVRQRKLAKVSVHAHAERLSMLGGDRHEQPWRRHDHTRGGGRRRT